MVKRNRYIDTLNGKITFLLFLVLIFLLFCVCYFYFYGLVNVSNFEVKFSVGKSLGMVGDVDEGVINFGRAVEGSIIEKKVMIENNYDFDLKVKVFVEKEISNFVYSESEYEVLRGDSLKIPFTLMVSKGVSEGDYSGQARLEFWRV